MASGSSEPRTRPKTPSTWYARISARPSLGSRGRANEGAAHGPFHPVARILRVACRHVPVRDGGERVGDQDPRPARPGRGASRQGLRLQRAHPRRFAVRRLQRAHLRRCRRVRSPVGVHAGRAARRGDAVRRRPVHELHADRGARPSRAGGQGAVGHRHVRAAHVLGQESAHRHAAHVPASHDVVVVRHARQCRQAHRHRRHGPVRRELRRLRDVQGHGVGRRLVLGRRRHDRRQRASGRVRDRHDRRHAGLGEHRAGRELRQDRARTSRPRPRAVDPVRRVGCVRSRT